MEEVIHCEEIKSDKDDPEDPPMGEEAVTPGEYEEEEKRMTMDVPSAQVPESASPNYDRSQMVESSDHPETPLQPDNQLDNVVTKVAETEQNELHKSHLIQTL